MVNMNKFEEPSVYALVAPDGGLFYVGRTTKNAQNRLWEHIYRARINHQAPVYQKMREVGLEDVAYMVLHYLEDGDDAKEIEAAWIKSLLDTGHDLVNAYGRTGIPDGWDEERRERGNPKMKGRDTWIKGKRGEEAGWTEERRRAQSERHRARAKPKPATIAKPKMIPKWQTHGTVASYTRGKCRCEPCGTAYREYKRTLYKTPYDRKRPWQYKQ